MRVAFGEFVFDLDSRELLRQGARTHLSGKAFQLLELLVRNRPRAVSKAELMEALWPGIYVLESNLAGLIAEIRKALGQAGRGGPIRTVHSFGYAFDAEVEASQEPVLCHLVWPGGQAGLGAGVFDIGRDPTLAVLVEASTVSWRHARLEVAGAPNAPAVSVEDLSSRNGTFVNGERVSNATVVRDGDEMRLGSVTLRVRLAGSTRQPTDPLE